MKVLEYNLDIMNGGKKWKKDLRIILNIIKNI